MTGLVLAFNFLMPVQVDFATILALLAPVLFMASGRIMSGTPLTPANLMLCSVCSQTVIPSFTFLSVIALRSKLCS